MTMDLDTVVICLEDDEESVVQRALLTSVSTYFHNAFGVRFQEAYGGSIFLEGVTEPLFRMFLHWLHAQGLQYSTEAKALPLDTLLLPEEAEHLLFVINKAGFEDPTEEKPGEIDGDSTTYAFDQSGFHRTGKTYQALYHTYTTWLKNLNRFDISVARLFVSADRYGVLQLRDDILTAWLGQSWQWDWSPVIHPNLVILTRDHLPVSSQFVKFLASSIAWNGFYPGSSSDADAAKMRALHVLSPGLTLEAAIVLAQKLESSGSDDLDISVSVGQNIPSAYNFHDHVSLTHEQCRHRISTRQHIFRAVLEACLQDAMAPSAPTAV